MNIKDVKKVAILGGGTMGCGLAQVFASAGYQTCLYDIYPAALDKALTVIRTGLGTFAEMGLIPETRIEEAIGNISTTLSLEEAVSDADFIIEAIIEKIAAKKEIYQKIDQLCPERTIIASNTSFLNIFEVMPERRLPQTAITHWFAPPQIVPLVEVVRGAQTTDQTVEFLLAILRQSDKVPVVMEKFVPGFCINRMLRIIGREVFFLLDNGYITPENLDLAVKASIIPRAMVLGFVQRYDFTGLDLSAMNLENEGFLEPPHDNHPKSLFDKVDRGDYGVKSGRGFYDYSDRPMEEVLKARDIELIRVFNSLRELMGKHI
jgi:3-hydroxybutyryl-CoA dehydrogenase